MTNVCFHPVGIVSSPGTLAKRLAAKNIFQTDSFCECDENSTKQLHFAAVNWSLSQAELAVWHACLTMVLVWQAYNEAEEILLRVYGFLHPSIDRLYLNLGIAHEESGDYYKAFHYFHRWFDNCRDLYGLEHSKTRRPISTLNEPMYRRIATELSVDIPAPLADENT